MSESDDLRRGWRECMMLGPSDALWDAKVAEAKERANEHNRQFALVDVEFDAPSARAPSEPLRKVVLLPGDVVVTAGTLLAAEARIKDLESRMAWLDEMGVLREATRRHASGLAEVVARCLKGRGEA